MKPIHALVIVGGVAALGVWYYRREKARRIEAVTKQAADAVAGAQDLASKTFDAVAGFFAGPGSTQGPPVKINCAKPSTDAERTYCAGIRQETPAYAARWNMIAGAYQIDLGGGRAWECQKGEDRSPGSTPGVTDAELAAIDRACSAVGA